MNEFSKFWLFLSKKKKLNFFLIVFLSIFQALLELISIAAVIPFITFLLKPDELNNYQFIFESINLKVPREVELKSFCCHDQL